MNTVRKKAPNPVDQHVGSRVRVRRMMLAMSQSETLQISAAHLTCLLRERSRIIFRFSVCFPPSGSKKWQTKV